MIRSNEMSCLGAQYASIGIKTRTVVLNAGSRIARGLKSLSAVLLALARQKAEEPSPLRNNQSTEIDRRDARAIVGVSDDGRA